LQGEASNVQADAQVHTFLFEVRRHVRIAKRPSCSSYLLEGAILDPPSPRKELSTSQRHVRRELDGVLERDRRCELGRPAEVDRLPAQRIGEVPGRWRRVVVVDPQQVETDEARVLGEPLTLGQNLLRCRRLLGLSPGVQGTEPLGDEASIDENGKPLPDVSPR
jgi:hypothetical protein